jgi:hypothetical protein
VAVFSRAPTSSSFPVSLDALPLESKSASVDLSLIKSVASVSTLKKIS